MHLSVSVQSVVFAVIRKADSNRHDGIMVPKNILSHTNSYDISGFPSIVSEDTVFLGMTLSFGECFPTF